LVSSRRSELLHQPWFEASKERAHGCGENPTVYVGGRIILYKLFDANPIAYKGAIEACRKKHVFITHKYEHSSLHPFIQGPLLHLQI